MSVKTIWHIRHACEQETGRDLPDLRSSTRVGRARLYADGDCPSYWGAKKRAADTRQWREKQRAARLKWERAAAMPALEGSEKAASRAGQVRHQPLTAVDELFRDTGHDDDVFEADFEEPARRITSASWWIDQRDADPPDLAELVADAAAGDQVRTSAENPC